jgi:hypothetical protein
MFTSRWWLLWACALAMLASVVSVPATWSAQSTGPSSINLADWTVGDVHMHAAGDSGLNGHVRCPGLDPESCADVVVSQTLGGCPRMF